MAGATPAALGLLADISERFPDDRGAIMGLYSVFLAVGQIIGALIGGFAAEAAGIDGMLVATGVLLLVALLPLARLRRAEDPVTGIDRVIDGHPWSPVPLARGARGAVVAPHHLATAAGLHILRAGGSAVDAAIATNAVLGVVMPNGCGIGGDAFWLIWDAAASRQYALNGSGRSAAGIDAAALRERGLRAMPRRGPLTITVPGAVRSWGDAARAVRAAVAGRGARPGHRAGTGRVPGMGRSSSTAVEATSRLLADQPGSGVRVRGGVPATRRPLAARRARPPAGAGGHARDAGPRGLRCVLRRRPRPSARPGRWRAPVRRSRRRTCASTARRGASRSGSTTAASG